MVAESAILTIFVAAYIYIGKSPHEPTPQQILTAPIFATICLLSGSPAAQRPHARPDNATGATMKSFQRPRR